MLLLKNMLLLIKIQPSKHVGNVVLCKCTHWHDIYFHVRTNVGIIFCCKNGGVVSVYIITPQYTYCMYGNPNLNANYTTFLCLIILETSSSCNFK